MSANPTDSKSSESKSKKSPRAPSLALDEALNRVSKLYKAEGRHAAPVDVVLKHIGYSSKNGAALQALASLGYWGLVERPKDGMVAAAKVFEDHEFNPDQDQKAEIILRLLQTPTLFAELLRKYTGRLPSDASIKFDLIQQGFIPSSADNCVSVFRKSVEFARYYELNVEKPIAQPEGGSDTGLNEDTEAGVEGKQTQATGTKQSETQRSPQPPFHAADGEVDSIPIRLTGGRKAWLVIPKPFFAADVERIKKYIDLQLTEEEEDDFH